MDAVEEIKKLVKDAEAHAEDDKKKKEKVDVRNNADALIFNLEKQMREHDAKITDSVKKKVNEKMNIVKDLLKKEDTSAEELKKATEELATEAQEIGKIIYEEAQKAEQKGGAEKKGKDNIVDAEVVDEKEEKRKKK